MFRGSRRSCGGGVARERGLLWRLRPLLPGGKPTRLRTPCPCHYEHSGSPFLHQPAESALSKFASIRVNSRFQTCFGGQGVLVVAVSPGSEGRFGGCGRCCRAATDFATSCAKATAVKKATTVEIDFAGATTVETDFAEATTVESQPGYPAAASPSRASPPSLSLSLSLSLPGASCSGARFSFSSSAVQGVPRPAY